MKTKLKGGLFVLLSLLVPTWAGVSASAKSNSASGDALDAYFRNETQLLADRCLTDVKSRADWESRREGLRQELFEMLSLAPLPVRADLQPVITGKLERDQFTVEKVHFQSMPGLYVTANLYLPKPQEKPAPAILYVCGHAPVITNGVSYGNKTAYQHHGAWFAENGYVCLMIDTIQLGEIQGLHHGTYREGMWWWNSRGYTPAGVEAWNCIRALDYLQSRPEVDGSKLGVTGRSGGGAYSWWVTALDERIKVAAPVAGITDLQNHVVDGVVEGHCDCMFMVNTYRWDYPQVAALAAPRPLLICNSDKDSIFPLDGVIRLHTKVRGIYQLYAASSNLGLLITEGPHKDTQDLQLPVLRWFNRHLKGEEPLIETAAKRFSTPEKLKVFDQLPVDERVSKIQDSFVPIPELGAPKSSSEWEGQRTSWMTNLVQHVFRGWPNDPEPLQLRRVAAPERDSGPLQVYEFTSDHDVRLRLYILQSAGPARNLRLTVFGEQEWRDWVQSETRALPGALRDEAAALGPGIRSDSSPVLPMPADTIQVGFAPRGIGLNAWNQEQHKPVQVRRRFMLLGQTLDSMRVWDIRRAIQALRSIDEWRALPLTIESAEEMGVNALYSALFEKDISHLTLSHLPNSHRLGPDYLNVLRFLDIPQALAMAAERSEVELDNAKTDDWTYPTTVASLLGWAPERLQIRGFAN